MSGVKSHRDLIVWQKAMDMAVLIYRTTESLPPHERFGLTSQITRAASSVAANIAEGNARHSPKDYARFISIARGSLMETETFLTLALRLNYLNKEQTQAIFVLIEEIDRMLLTLHTKITQIAKQT